MSTVDTMQSISTRSINRTYSNLSHPRGGEWGRTRGDERNLHQFGARNLKGYGNTTQHTIIDNWLQSTVPNMDHSQSITSECLATYLPCKECQRARCSDWWREPENGEGITVVHWVSLLTGSSVPWLLCTDEVDNLHLPTVPATVSPVSAPCIDKPCTYRTTQYIYRIPIQ